MSLQIGLEGNTTVGIERNTTNIIAQEKKQHQAILRGEPPKRKFFSLLSYAKIFPHWEKPDRWREHPELLFPQFYHPAPKQNVHAASSSVPQSAYASVNIWLLVGAIVTVAAYFIVVGLCYWGCRRRHRRLSLEQHIARAEELLAAAIPMVESPHHHYEEIRLAPSPSPSESDDEEDRWSWSSGDQESGGDDAAAARVAVAVAAVTWAEEGSYGRPFQRLGPPPPPPPSEETGEEDSVGAAAASVTGEDDSVGAATSINAIENPNSIY